MILYKLFFLVMYLSYFASFRISGSHFCHRLGMTSLFHSFMDICVCRYAEFSFQLVLLKHWRLSAWLLVIQACIITRSRLGTLDLWQLGSNGSSWYILETNYDHWKPPLFLDDRRTPAHRCMNNMTQKVRIFTLASEVVVCAALQLDVYDVWFA